MGIVIGKGGIELRRMRMGFTLVELLIVIFIIGILASTMILSIVSTSDSAKASVVVSNLRHAKAAGLMWFASNASSTDIEFVSEWTNASMRDNLERYVDSARIYNYDFFLVPSVGYLIGEPNVNSAVINRAIKNATGIRLLDANGVAFVYPVPEGEVTVCIKVK